MPVAVDDRGRRTRRLLIFGGTGLFLASLLALALMLWLPSLSSDSDAAPMPTPGATPEPTDDEGVSEPPGGMSQAEAQQWLRDMAAANPDYAEDFLAIEEVIDEQGDDIEGLEGEIADQDERIDDLEEQLGVSATSSTAAPDPAAGIAAIVAISGAITGAVSAAAGVIAAIAATQKRRHQAADTAAT